jgi:hypothetical protein
MSSVSTEARRCAARVAPLDPATYVRHAIHGEDRTWAETNCYTDLLVELLHGIGHDPVAMLPFTLAIDFEGDQWTFFKPAHTDLATLYGIDIQELAMWKAPIEHVCEQVSAGRPVLIELDSYWLPDTSGTAYRIAHQKTTVGVNEIDYERGYMAYFHNQGFYGVEGEDFRKLFDLPGLPPYVEFVKTVPDFRRRTQNELLDCSLAVMRTHLMRAPRENPFVRFKARLLEDLESLLASDIGHFHKYSFATLRQYGACFELAETYLAWLAARSIAGLEVPRSAFTTISQTAKAFQFQLARSMTRKKTLDLAPLDTMAAQWDIGMTLLQSRYA